MEGSDRKAQFEIFPDDAGEKRFRLRSANGEIVIPPEGHRDENDVLRAIDDCVRTVLEAVGLEAQSFGLNVERVDE